MIRLTSVGMEKIGQIQDKYRFKNNFELEAHDVYDFCKDILEAHNIGLCIDDEDLEFIEMVWEKICE